ncbi:hypothetical protein NQ314_019102 [Rhamnusium bicolor]|uniref:Cytochrome P450 n=1 Tax=Rhamnusium bicolor TaxID=1586634 RepID=A0AAV8WQD4_9CUCU|nr:hypothetical protein NQ314_019102 [Rhamnusium bicolor]
MAELPNLRSLGNEKPPPAPMWGRASRKQPRPILIKGSKRNPADMSTKGRGSPAGVATRYFGLYQFAKPILILKDPDLIKQITIKDFNHFTDHRTFLPDTEQLFSKSLFILKDKEVVTVEMKDIFTRYTSDVIATTAFGIKVDSLAEANNEFYLMGKDATDFTTFSKTMKFFAFFMSPKISKVLRLRLFSNEMTNYFRQLINDTIKVREEKAIVRPDMIHLLMEARKGNHKNDEDGIIDTGFATVQESDLGNKSNIRVREDLTNDDITAQALIFFLAGFDGVATNMCFAAYELAVNQDVQERLREEVYATLEECGGKLTYESLLKMKYMDMVVSARPRKTREQQFFRWYPSLSYPDPDRFDPERFSDENKANINPYTYMPFGVGPRNCIGSRFALLETKIVFFFILQHFQIVPVEKTQIPLKISRKSFSMTAANGFWFGLKRLKN